MSAPDRRDPVLTASQIGATS